jgi:hypothetical protein
LILMLCASHVAVAETAKPRDRVLWGYGGVGFGRALNDEMPGGSWGAQVGFLHRLRRSPHYAVGGEAHWLNLGSATRSRRIAGATVKNDYTYTVVPLSCQFSYIPPASPENPRLTASIGLGIYSVKEEWANHREPGQPRLPFKEITNDAHPGLSAGGGLVYGSKNAALRFGVDGKFHFVLAEDRSLSIVTLLGRLYI